MGKQKIKKVFDILLKIVLCLIILTPILGLLGVFPEPTRELYNTDVAFDFINMIMQTKFVNYIMALVFAFAIILIITKRTAFAALLIFPITICIVGFHAFLNGGLFTTSAILGNILFLLNVYFLWQNREVYSSLLERN